MELHGDSFTFFFLPGFTQRLTARKWLNASLPQVDTCFRISTSDEVSVSVRENSVTFCDVLSLSAHAGLNRGERIIVENTYLKIK
jgi:hypothetical protein